MALAVTACGGSVTQTDCNDGLDNDGDGLIDGQDPGCELNGNVVESPDPAQCTDTLDNDGDGLIDLADWGCEGASDDEENDPTRACNDGVDNDGDGVIDLADPGCENPVDNDEYQLAQCEDFVDNDSDGVIDFPFEPGCDSPMDPDETNPDPLPECSDGIDNDNSGFTDFPTDTGCESAADTVEWHAQPGICGPGLETVDITAAAEATATIDGPLPNELTSDTCNGYGGELTYTYQVTTPGKALLISTDHPETTLDTVVYVRTDCRRPDTELGCNDDSTAAGPTSGGSELIIPLVDVGTYFIIVDAFGPGSLGTFKMTVEERNGLHGACDPADAGACVPGLICQPLWPGDPNTCEFPRCDDGLDNDGDAIIDFPFEPGCGSAGDNDETDGAPLECSNGVDDDADGFIDYPADPGCEFAADPIELDECYPGKPVLPLDLVTGATGSTVGESNLTSGTCGGADSGEDVYAFTVTVPLTSLTLTTNTPGSSYDTILYVRTGDCAAGTQVACNNDAGFSTNKSTVTFTPVLGSQYFVFVDGGWMATGSYDIDVSGIIAAGGTCDPALSSFVCVSGYTCKESAIGAADFECRVALCNDALDNDADGLVDYPNDPGCATPSDDNEDFPNPVTACHNGLDDDGDGLIDFPADLGCNSAADDGEIDECVVGSPVSDHPGGTVTGDTTGAPTLLSAACDTTGTSASAPEEVWVYNVTTDLTSITFSTAGSAFDTVLYIRSPDCGVAGPSAWCNDNNGTISTSLVTIADPAPGTYFAVVDGMWSGSGSYNLSITGVVDLGGACTAGSTSFVCEPGTACGATGICEAAACSDGIDNDADGDIDYPADPGCTGISDPSETDPSTLPQCADGIDNDGDGATDWPADDSCGAASDDNEACSVFASTTSGYSGCTDDLPAIPPCEDLSTSVGALTACSSDDCISAGLALGFTFNYFGVDHTTVDVQANGKLGWGVTSAWSNSCTIENNTVDVYWDDLDPGAGGALRYQTFGTAPNRHFTVQWNVPHIGGGTSYDIRAVLYEGSNDIDVCYVDTVSSSATTDDGASATAGIHGAIAADNIQYSCNAPNVTSGLLIKYTAP